VALELSEIQVGYEGGLHRTLLTDYGGGRRGYAALAGHHLGFVHAVAVDRGECWVGSADAAAGLGAEGTSVIHAEPDSRDGRRGAGLE
jgi:hypothetical protein